MWEHFLPVNTKLMSRIFKLSRLTKPIAATNMNP
jgi:hypothetical protein